MPLPARTIGWPRAAALAIALALCCPASDASAAPRIAAPGEATTVGAKPPTPPQVLPGIRPGERKLECHKHDAKVQGVYDFGGDRPGSMAYRTPAQTLRRYLAAQGTDRNLQGLRYERRAPYLLPGATKADARRRALFVGLRKDGTVKAAIGLDRVGRGDAMHWRVGGIDMCVKGNQDPH